MDPCERRGSGNSSLSIPLSDIDGISQCDSNKYLEEADYLQCRVGLEFPNASNYDHLQGKDGKYLSSDCNQNQDRQDAKESVEVEPRTANNSSEILGRTISLSSQPLHAHKHQGQPFNALDEHIRKRARSLSDSIAKSKRSHTDLQSWDKKMGNKMSFSRTMSNTSASRVLVEQITKELCSQTQES